MNNMNIYNNLPNYHPPPTPPKASGNSGTNCGNYMNVNYGNVTPADPSTISSTTNPGTSGNSQENLLRIENRALRNQNEQLKAKVIKFENFESEIPKVYQAHES